MSQKRMFDKSVVKRDEFLEMPDGSQILYFQFSMDADDDGFVDNWKSIMRMCGKKEDDLKILILKKFIIPFDSGIIVIKHWRINNYLRSDRYNETKYLDEKNLLNVDENGAYSLVNTSGIPTVYTEEYSIDKNSIDKNSIVQKKLDGKSFNNILDNNFEKFWNAYPKKIGKKKAEEIFKKLKVDIDILLTAIEQQKKSSQWQNEQYIPNPTTWLNQERWNDELKENKQTAKNYQPSNKRVYENLDDLYRSMHNKTKTR